MDLYNYREDYHKKTLHDLTGKQSPSELFKKWLNDAIDEKCGEPNAMALSTINEYGYPETRIVLLKKIDHGLLFFTNYNSNKARQIEQCPKVSINFHWHKLERQLRIMGKCEKITKEESDDYFTSRPRSSQIGAWASPQSKVIPDREYLEKLNNQITEKFSGQPIPRPENWGGYRVIPQTWEFWQGRTGRLHDRIFFEKQISQEWTIKRLAP